MKSDVDRWDTEDGYRVSFPGGDCEVAVQVGSDGSAWYIRTTDDAGGSDECEDTCYLSQAEARAAASAFAAARSTSR